MGSEVYEDVWVNSVLKFLGSESQVWTEQELVVQVWERHDNQQWTIKHF